MKATLFWGNANIFQSLHSFQLFVPVNGIALYGVRAPAIITERDLCSLKTGDVMIDGLLLEQFCETRLLHVVERRSVRIIA